MVDKERLESAADRKNFIKTAWKAFNDSFHKFGMWIIISLFFGICIGIWTSNKYVTTRIDEVVKVGGFLHKERVYSVIPR